ncbi:hypothetical protein Lesp02_03650 [Lentzea sp. NBRC 105346]|uniref:GNAT family N-acetyltransferase n=1 Tax=Lentzea sp. NBRC 105346 TaxID=3032205 RepID=UPI0024A5B4A8|nr:GNAT family N-acetyltransferase [Lentzea sp. NBRC 105346]GLZ28175.1 hypothetical protein Lesp02_03650 [Lentzea sp. NBRC 105346]
MTGQMPLELRPAVTVRPLDAAADLPAVRAMVDRCSPRALRHRFLATGIGVCESYLDTITRDKAQHTEVATRAETILGIGSLLPMRRRGAEVCLLVDDGWHGRGVGSAIAVRLGVRAAARGITHVKAHVLVGNRSAHTLISRLCPGARAGPPDAGVVVYDVPVGRLGLLTAGRPIAADDF